MKISIEYYEQLVNALPDDASLKELAITVGLDVATDMIGYDFSGVDFAGEDLTGVDFTDCNCHGVNWQGADVAGCKFRGARLDPWSIFLAKNAHLATF